MKHRDDTGLFDYQCEMKGSLYDAWAQVRSVMCQMPTGTGKTHLLVSVVRDCVRSEGKPVWIVVHRIELVEQICSTLSRYGMSHGRLVSGSSWSGEPVQVVSIQTLSSLIESGRLSIICEEETIVCEEGTPVNGTGKLVRANGEFSLPGIDVSAPVMVHQAPGLLVIDEAHHAPARSYARLWELLPEAYKLGMTATPYRLSGGGFTSLYDCLLTSHSVSRFIEEGRLALFDYLSILPDSEAQRRVDSLSKRGVDGDYSLKEMGGVLDCPEAIAQLYDSYRAFAEGKKGIIYAINRAHSQHIRDYYESRGVRIVAIDSRTPWGERRESVERYTKGEIDVLVNVDIFSEGFDCPLVEFIQLARPTLSLSKYLQQVGRGLRVHPSKVRTVILDQVGLYLQFGLPTEERNWQSFFRGGKSVRVVREEERSAYQSRVALLERTALPEQSAPFLSSLQMGVVQVYGDFLRQVCNRRAEVTPYEDSGLYGLRKGDEIILPPSYPCISPFVERHALVTHPGNRFGIMTQTGTLLPLPKCQKIELYAGSLAYVEESPVIRYYLDLKTFYRYESRPELLSLDFLEFVHSEGCYCLRMRQRRWKTIPSFFRTDLHIEGDLFFHEGIFIHRSAPSEIYWYEYTDEEGNLIGSDRNDNLYLCSPGKAPVYYGQKKWVDGIKRWKFVNSV